MKAAVVKGAGERPVHMEFESPRAMPDHCLIDVTASALSQSEPGWSATATLADSATSAAPMMTDRTMAHSCTSPIP